MDEEKFNDSIVCGVVLKEIQEDLPIKDELQKPAPLLGGGF